MKTYYLELSGPWACFTRPEMKVERVSYDVMTPSAARACFEAILWKPAIRWQVRRIEVLKPIRWINLRRNEVASVVSTRTDWADCSQLWSAFRRMQQAAPANSMPRSETVTTARHPARLPQCFPLCCGFPNITSASLQMVWWSSANA